VRTRAAPLAIVARLAGAAPDLNSLTQLVAFAASFLPKQEAKAREFSLPFLVESLTKFFLLGWT
jgi:hypothetical protein